MTMLRSSSVRPAVRLGAVGYRLDELIGVGVSANVYRGRLDVDDGAVPDVGLGALPTESWSSSRDEVVVKVCVLGADGSLSDPEGRSRECRALDLRPISAMPRLLDLGTTERGELVLVMTPCRGRPMNSGVTVDAETLLRLVEGLHEAGVAHGGLDPDAVLIDDDGSPSLVGFRRAVFEGDSGFETAVGADLRAVAALARRPSASPRAAAVSEAAGDAHGWRGGGDCGPDGGHATSAVDVDRDDGWRWVDDEAEHGSTREPAFLETLEPAVLALRESGSALRSLVRTRSVGALALRRRTVLIAGGTLIVAATVAGCLLIPPGPPAGSSRSDHAGATGGATESPISDASPAGREKLGDAREPPGTGAARKEGSEGSQTPARAAVLADDPVAAADALLNLRERCLQTHEPRCLDTVDQWNAPAMVADLELDRNGATQADPLGTLSTLTLVERIGATALLSAKAGDDRGPDTTKPVSLLMMRGETGWRLRSYQVGQRPP